MQVDIATMTGALLGSLIILAFGCAIPGLAALRILDPTADRFRQMMLTPALGLLLLMGISGWSVLLFNGYSSTIILMLILALNGLGISILRHQEETISPRISTWARLEQAMGIERDELEVDMDIWSEDTWSEVEEQHRIQSLRPAWWPIPIFLAVLFSLAPLFLFRFPHGVDWIGFSTLTNSFATTGNLSLPPPSQGYWTYPPAFPALAALLQQSLDIGPEVSAHILARLGLLSLFLGIVGVCDRWGSGILSLIAMSLASGLLAKAHDSGWPTVMSQLGLILGLLVVIKPAGKRRREHDLAFAVGVLSVAVIHPTGAIYLGTLLLANLIVRQLHDREDERAVRIITISAIMLAVAAAVTFLLFAPRLLDEAVFAEYGWQGGWPMLIYTSPLLPLALYFGWQLRNTVEGGVILLWLLLQWILTLIHLFDGINIPVLSLMSYSLYSMGLHAFHLPAAVLLGMAFARGVEWTPIEGDIDLSSESNTATDNSNEVKEYGEASLEYSLPKNVDGSDYSWNENWQKAIIIVASLLFLSAGTALVSLADHPELFVTTDGDREISALLAELPADSVVFVENSHWGYVYDLDAKVGITAFPSLGMISSKDSIQTQASLAIRQNDMQTLDQLKISHAISSPISNLVFTLSTSPYWQVEIDIDGARLWTRQNQPIVDGEGWFSTPTQDDCNLDNDCSWRVDNWLNQRTWKISEWSDSRGFLAGGQIGWNDTMPSHLIDNTLELAFLVECSQGVVATIELSQDDWNWQQKVNCKSGWGYAYDDGVKGISRGDLNISLSIEDYPQETWINPLGLSGRGDRIIDTGGLRIHWLELRKAG